MICDGSAFNLALDYILRDNESDDDSVFRNMISESMDGCLA